MSSDSTPTENLAAQASFTIHSVVTYILSKLGISLDNLLF